ncbi:MAG: DUF805 domain-containing protein [Roseicyclus sp.]|jgi:uncharacterized membrane protein YhaH (DUF805 family)
MDFMTAVRTCLGKYVTFSGRAQRSEYWWWALFSFGGNVVLQFVDGVLFGSVGGQQIGVLAPLFSLAVFLPSISVGVRRLHDLDKSGWWLLIALVPLIGFLVLLYFFVQRGTEGSNQFGADPLAGTRTPA